MRPRKSSTIIKKSQTLINSKQPTQQNTFSTNQSHVSHLAQNSSYFHSFEAPIRGNFEIKGGLNKGSINPTSGFRRTISTAVSVHQLQKNDSNLNKNKKIEAPLLAEDKPIAFTENHNKEPIVKQSLYQENTQKIKQQKITKTRVAFYQSTPKTQHKKTQPGINPQQKITMRVPQSRNRQQILNTRRSKLQSEVKKKQALQKQEKKALQKQEKQKSLMTPLKKSKNINIHTIKNPSIVRNVEKGEKGEVKSELKDQKILIDKKMKEENNEYIEVEAQKKQEMKRQQRPHVVNHALNSYPNQPVQPIQSQSLSPVQQRAPDSNNRNNRKSSIVQSNITTRPERQAQNSHPLNPPQQNSPSFNHNQTQSSPSLQAQSQIQQIEQVSFNRIPSSFQQPQNRPNNQTNRNERNQPENQRSLNLSALIANTQDIINFINRLNLRSRVQAFDLMVGQLTQLNLIAQQVQQLGQIGNNLGYSLVNVFGTRIRQLQTTIINQVGMALIASFEQRIDPQFQALVIRQPCLRQGFSSADIQRTFQEKITFEQAECSICLENVKPGDTLIELQCFHDYHPICIRTWLENSRKCPMCRMEQKL